MAIGRILSYFIVSLMAIGLVSASSYDLEFNQVGDKLVIKEKIDGNQTKSYVDSESLNVVGKEMYFVNRVIFPDDFGNVKIKLNLEKGVIIQSKEVFPSNYEIESDGQTISVIWALSDVEKGDNFAIFANLEDTKKGFSYIWIAVIVIAVILVGLFFLRRGKIPKKVQAVKRRRERKTENYGYLLDTEKKVIEELKKADRNELWQKQIQNFTGFSKAKVSRLIRNLESRGLIKKIPMGNTNKIVLK